GVASRIEIKTAAAVGLRELLREVLRIAAHEGRGDTVREAHHLSRIGGAVEGGHDVEALRTRGLEKALQAEPLQQGAQQESRTAQGFRVVARGIEVEDADVGVPEARDARSPHVRRDRVLVGHPDERPSVGDERVAHCAAPLRDLDTLEPVGAALADILLPEALRADAARVALERDWTAPDVGQHRGSDRLVVRGQLALGDPVVGEEHLLRVRYHAFSLTTSRAALSTRIPSSRGWRSFPCPVHSMNATCTTTSGRTQCAPVRGSPVPMVNGAFAVSRWSSRARSSRSPFRLKPAPVPTRPANTKSCPSKTPPRSAPRPTRLPWGSVNPPMTSSCVASHFIFSQCGERRCS